MNVPDSDITAIAALIGQAQKASQHHGEIPHITLPEGFTVQSIEHLLPAPSRIRGIFRTRDPEAFITYVHRHKIPGKTVIFRNDKEITCIIDFHGKDGQAKDVPGWCEHQAILVPDGKVSIDDERISSIPVFRGGFEPLNTED